MLTAPELTGELLTAVSAMAAGAPSSMLPTALLRLWTRAMELEMEVGVHNGARDAALQAAIDLLAAPAPSMCSPAAGASPFEIAIGMKEWHSWSSLKVRVRLHCGPFTTSALLVGLICVCKMCLVRSKMQTSVTFES